jgi:hypothetical protein
VSVASRGSWGKMEGRITWSNFKGVNYFVCYCNGIYIYGIYTIYHIVMVYIYVYIIYIYI